MTKTSHIGSLLALLLASACGNPNSAPPSSPTKDVPPTTSDGEVVGADREPPAQKLQEGPQLDSHEGLKPAAQPGKD
jgi:hypothetical protein